MCSAQAITVSGNTGYSIGTGAHAPIMAPSPPLPPGSGPAPQKLTNVCVKKLLYQPTYLPASNAYGLCIYLAAVNADKGDCSNETVAAIPDGQQGLNWVQTIVTDQRSFSEGDNDFTREACKINVPHKDPCIETDPKVQGSPLYRPDLQNVPFHAPDPRFQEWHDLYGAKELGDLRLLFRDVPDRIFNSRDNS